MKKKLFGLLLVSLLIITPVYADKINKNDSNFLSDDNLTVETNLFGNLFAAGNNVKVKNEVDGITFVGGSKVTITNKSDYVFAAGQDVELDGTEAKDVFLAGQNINVNDSKLRDIFIAGSTIVVKDNTIRNARIAGGKITIKGEVTGDLYLAAENVVIEEESKITGKLVINEDAKLDVSKKATLEKIEKYESSDKKVNVKVNPVKAIFGRIIENIISCASLLIIALLMVLIAKKFFVNIKKLQKDDNIGLKALGVGFLLLCAIPVISIFVMITIIGIPLAIVTLLLYGLFIYLSAIPSSYFIGSLIFKDKIENDYLLITVSLLLFYLAKLIPLAGGILSFASLILGLGLFYYIIKGTVKK